MKKILSILILSILILGCQSKTSEPNASDGGEHPSGESADWQLVFEDDFEGDLSAWNVWTGGAFNEEIQFYQPEQVSLTDDGLLKIAVQRQATTGPTTPFDTTPKDFEYVSGRLESKMLYAPKPQAGKEELRYMARIKLPAGIGMWPAFWSYGDPWPTQGEIDVLEARVGEPFKFQSNIFYGTAPGQNLIREQEAYFELEDDLTADFHVYELIWTENKLEILLDGKLMHRYTANAENYIAELFGKEQKIVLNTAVGGWFFQNRDSSTYADESVMLVDWVRVYQR
ncbi:glycoside hydrolase family 16 protein [Croceiramulus getboli]|nr:glycoside hydrolase family 16 protein [Flavobacteriaceae bacterium YJPT1-3]